MPLIIPPSITTLPSRKGDQFEYAMTFRYDFGASSSHVADPIVELTVNQYFILGSQYILNLNSVPSSPANLPPFKSMQFMQTFLPSNLSAGSADGSLLIYVPSTGQFIDIGSPGLPNDFANVNEDNYSYVVSGIIPLPVNPSSSIIFSKERYSNAGDLAGSLSVTLFTFDAQPYISQGATTIY